MRKIIFYISFIILVSCNKKDDDFKPGSEIYQLTNHPEGIEYTEISEDGSKIFYSVRSRNKPPVNGNYDFDIYSINSDGSNLKKLITISGIAALQFAVSKNNKLLAISTAKNTSPFVQSEILICNIDGTSLRTLQTYIGSLTIKAFVENDQSVLYSKPMQIGNTIRKMRIDNSNDTILVEEGGVSPKAISANQNLFLVNNSNSVFSIDMDGNNIVDLGINFVGWIISPINKTFVLTKSMPTSTIATVQIFVSDASGANKTQVTSSEMMNLPVSFFPDGQEILFSSNKSLANDNESELFSVRADGTGLKRLTHNDYNEKAIGFLENKKKILFVATKDGPDNLYVLDLK